MGPRRRLPPGKSLASFIFKYFIWRTGPPPPAPEIAWGSGVHRHHRVALLFGAGAVLKVKVKAANLELDEDRALDPALNTLVEAMQALAPGGN